MPNIIPCRIWNGHFSPDAERRARQYPESDGRHPKHDAPVPLPDDWRDRAGPDEDKPTRVRQFPEPHRWRATSLLES